MAVGDVNMPALDNWTELSGFQKLRNDAQTDSKSALPAVAKQFEAIFTQMMLKSMRDASFGDGMGDSEAGDTYRDMFDQQLSLSLSNSGRGIGIAQMLVKQLGGKDAGITPSVGGNAALSDTLAQITRTAGKVAGKAASVLPGAGDAVSFVQSLAPHAQAAAEKLGVSVRALLAQAALETGWGKHLPSHGDGSTSNNLFGMKAGSSWDGEKVSVPTLEYENGVAVRKRDQFANSPRYTAALGRGEDVRGFAHALVRGGYATDPAYANKLVAIANSPEMRQALDALKSGVSVPSQLP